MKFDKKVAVVIPSRYKSTRFPGKSLVDILGKPMVVRVADLSAKAVGVDNVYIATDDKRIGDLIKTLEPEDLLKYGLIPEFICRMPIVATLEDLDEKSLIKILQEPKNSLIKQYKELFKIEGAKLSFKDNASAKWI